MKNKEKGGELTEEKFTNAMKEIEDEALHKDCPHCGRCPICGRGDNYYPWYPRLYVYPWTDTTSDTYTDGGADYA